MPELPEVETTVRGIRPLVEGKCVREVVVRERRLRWPVAHGINRILSGKRILCVHRRAKYILIKFSHGTLMIHLGMSGRLQVVPKNVAPAKHDHVDIVLVGGKVLRFRDPRRFGSVLWVRGDPQIAPLLSRLGPEPFDEAFTGSLLFEAARGRRLAIKNFIMDGRIVVGIGNIYASEALFRAGIHPARAAGRVGLRRYQHLVQAIREVLADAIAAGGTSLRDYAGVTGEPGYFECSLKVYERVGEPCVNCGAIIQHKVIGQRASYYCAHCQH
ncbi:MAG TPA: DNA-formamidopyrimidine glycosylase [Gammaproteobacteria bacterium]|jgi:formamidopyrimidine-DNA glycosylase|nr:bifunctional DNA-formamidopyrimidine glycosylase/DNA-(apurinic or apyrimidinic site) lyase [Arenicellales bacterium]HCY14228.1 DNA-formamidopyrimidine glycosylase [Gammaproteobacteria bacterium]|tara:strand:+ start:247 stop:1062 length:816 start_codon:yes stop_codon:yes gene_type:complete